MQNRFQRGESPAALVDDLLREFAKVEGLAMADADRAPTNAASPGSNRNTPESVDRGGRMLRALNRRLLRWRDGSARVAGLN